jgi:hypothetical protein
MNHAWPWQAWPAHNWPWVVLTLLGAYHGLNPAMGWLFALALGLQEKRRSAVVGALLPIALGHAAAIATAILLIVLLQHLIPIHRLKWLIAAVIFGLGSYRLFRASHPRGAGMRVGPRDLALWSFLMASAHGAGLMLVPVLLARPMLGMHHAMAGATAVNDLRLNANTATLAILVHTASMLIVAGALALVFFEMYDHAGLRILRHAWFNFDFIWAIALMIAAIAVLL